jgi:hypothetical protein
MHHRRLVPDSLLKNPEQPPHIRARTHKSDEPVTQAKKMAAAAACEWGREPEHPDTYIYFIQAEQGGPIKIGRAQDVPLRLSQLQIGNWLTLRTTRVVVAVKAEEYRLHELFAQFRMSGEWFQPHPLVASIADARSDDSLAGKAIDYGGLRSEFRDAYMPGMAETMRTKEWKERAARLQEWYNSGRWRVENLDGVPHAEPEIMVREGIPWKTITYRPEPDERGWRNSSG